MDKFENTLRFQAQVELRRCGLGEWAATYVAHSLLGVTDPVEVLSFLLSVEDGELASLDLQLLEGFAAH